MLQDKNNPFEAITFEYYLASSQEFTVMKDVQRQTYRKTNVRISDGKNNL